MGDGVPSLLGELSLGLRGRLEVELIRGREHLSVADLLL